MPALLAYLLALSILIGGGYGAWIVTTPQAVVKSTAKVKPGPRPEARMAVATPLESHRESPAIAHREPVASGEPARTGDSGPVDPAALAAPATSAPDSTSAAVQPSPAVVPPAPSIQPPRNANASFTSAPARAVNAGQIEAKPAKRLAARQVPHAQRRPLEMMILRTIEYPDGRRTTQLIPYAPRSRVLAYR